LKSLETAEQEYKDAIDAIDKCKISHEEHHKLTWDLQQRLQEIADLQKDLSDTQLFLTEERKRFMKVVAENDELRGVNCENWTRHIEDSKNLHNHSFN
jgi:coiled-coil domain-containing protein 77